MTTPSAIALQTLCFALRVKRRHEKAVAHSLRCKQLEDFLPLYRESRGWSDRTTTVELPLFAGYVFCRFAYADRFLVLNTPGVTAILGAGSVFAPVAEEEIASIRTIVDSGLPARPFQYLTPGQLVVVERGPLAGIRGTTWRTKGATY